MIERNMALADLCAELTALDVEIARQRLIRERATYRLEQALRERDRVGRHLASLVSNEGAA